MPGRNIDVGMRCDRRSGHVSDETEPATAGSAAWWAARFARPTRTRKGGLSLERILAAALAIVDEAGLEALTMRRLAERLDTVHTSLYRHVATRDELLVLLMDHVMGFVRIPPDAVGWRARGEGHARAFRRTMLEHPNIVPLLGTGQLLGPNAMRGREYGVTTLLLEGAPAEVAVQAYLLVAHYTIGALLLETGRAARTETQRAAMTRLFAGLPGDRYPTVSANADWINQPDSDAEFDFGLATILDGVDLALRRLRA